MPATMVGHRGRVFIFMIGLYLTLLPKVVNSQSLSEVERLQADLLKDYNRDSRPRYNQSHVVDIYVALDLISIQEFNEVLETIKITALVNHGWVDERLVWDPSKYGGAYHLIMPVSSVWVPHLIMSNTVDKLEKLAEDWHLLLVLYNGTVFFYPGTTFSATCRVDVSYYPWDKQVCPFYFYVWGYTHGHVKLQSIHTDVQQTYYYDNGAWTLTNTRAYTIAAINNIVFELHLDRKPRFVVVNVIIPIIFMCILNMLVFLIPSESGERISYCITMLLALAVFLTLVSDNLPKTSNPMSIFSYYLMSIVVISMCITMATIFNLNIYHKSEKQTVTGFYLGFYRMVTCKLCGLRARIDRQKSYTRKHQNDEYPVIVANGQRNSSHGSLSDINIKSWTTSRETKARPLRPSYDDSSNFSRDRGNPESKNKQESEDNAVTWSDVSSAFDRVFFVSFVVLTMGNTAVFMYVMLTGESDLDLYGS